MVTADAVRVVDAEMRDVPADGETMGEVVMRGNNVMKGYFADEEATAEAFRGGWFHSGDLGVMHPDGYIEIRDRAKDIIISGGENISTIEVERALVSPPGRARGGGGRRSPTRSGASCRRRSCRSGPAPRLTEAELIAFCARDAARASRRRARSSSASCRRPRPARSRSSSCGSGHERPAHEDPAARGQVAEALVQAPDRLVSLLVVRDRLACSRSPSPRRAARS